MSTVDRSSCLTAGQYKINAGHLNRLACIYIRQSSLKQVEHNRESQFNQYQLAIRAEALGWNKERVRIIDTDLGQSATDSSNRGGFKDLVAEVSLGHVGIVFGYEVSRLARNNSDWYHLLDLAAVFSTLIADSDGVYDPRLFNDRLLLGLKGTMSEAELHLLRQRLEAGRMSQVRRAEYRQHLPTGLVRLPDGRVVKDPDEQVRQTIELVLEKFAELGSCQKVLRYLRTEKLLLPRNQRSGFQAGKLLWKEPSQAAVYDILCNPAYAGAFAYGRKQSDPTRKKPGHPSSGLVRKPMEQWLHLQRDVYPNFISWSQFLANQERLRQNGTSFLPQAEQQSRGAAREGRALLQGLVRCGSCGARMQVCYKRSVHRYQCDSLLRHFGLPCCASLHGASVDQVVREAFFKALRPAQLDALEAVLARQEREHQRLLENWQQRLKRAQYEVQLAERQYDAVDPDNRLVAAELERRWETRMQESRQIHEDYERFVRQPVTSALTAEMREQLTHICDAMPKLWPRLSNSEKKELVRCLISEVILRRVEADMVEVRIVWISGHYTIEQARAPIRRDQDVSGYDQMVLRIESLLEQGLNNDQIAAQLSREGFHSARHSGVSATCVQKIRLKKRWYLNLHRSRRALQLDGFLTPRGLAARLGVERTWVYNRIYSGRIDPIYVHRDPQSNIHLIQDDPDLISRLRQQTVRPRKSHIHRGS